MTSSAAPSGRRITSLDGLRGLAAAVVVLHHGLLTQRQFSDVIMDRSHSGPAWAEALGWSPLHLFWAGNEAVYVFFVLSGLVLTLPYAAGRRPNWRAYYPSRLIRLYGPVVAALAFAMVLFLAVSHRAYPGETSWTAVHHGHLDLKAAAFAFPLLAHVSMLDSPLWSLRWELAFSGLLPLYVYGVRALPSAGRAALLVLVAVATVWGPSWSVWLAMFAVGAVLAFERQRVERWVTRMPTAVGVVLTVVAAVLLVAQWSPVSIAPAGLPLSLAGAGVLVALFAAWPPLQRFGNRRVVQWLGTVSFSLYLVHEPILVAVAFLFRTSDALVVLGVGLPVAVAAGWAFNRLVEAPLHRLAKAVGARAGRGSPAAARPTAPAPDVASDARG